MFNKKFTTQKIAFLSLLLPLTVCAGGEPAAFDAPEMKESEQLTPKSNGARAGFVVFETLLVNAVPVVLGVLMLYYTMESGIYDHNDNLEAIPFSADYNNLRSKSPSLFWLITAIGPVLLTLYMVGMYVLGGLGIFDKMFKAELTNKNGQKASSKQRWLAPLFQWILPMAMVVLFDIVLLTLWGVQLFGRSEKSAGRLTKFTELCDVASLIFFALSLLWALVRLIWDLSILNRKKMTNERFSGTRWVEAKKAKRDKKAGSSLHPSVGR